jgi:hypothetical protein
MPQKRPRHAVSRLCRPAAPLPQRWSCTLARHLQLCANSEKTRTSISGEKLLALFQAKGTTGSSAASLVSLTLLTLAIESPPLICPTSCPTSCTTFSLTFHCLKRNTWPTRASWPLFQTLKLQAADYFFPRAATVANFGLFSSKPRDGGGVGRRKGSCPKSWRYVERS